MSLNHQLDINCFQFVVLLIFSSPFVPFAKWKVVVRNARLEELIFFVLDVDDFVIDQDSQDRFCW